jgi:hypothetical protein
MVAEGNFKTRYLFSVRNFTNLSPEMSVINRRYVRGKLLKTHDSDDISYCV